MNSTQLITEAHEHQKGKVCTNCKEHLPLSEFHKGGHKRYGGLSYKCKSCTKEYHDNMCRFKSWFISRKAKAKFNGIEFTLLPTDIPGVKIREVITIDRRGGKHTSWEATEYPKVCPVLGTELSWDMSGRQNESPSLDRIDSTKGYVKGNVMIMSDLANLMKSSATPEQKLTEARYYLFGDNK